jgi:hypothetical protein
MPPKILLPLFLTAVLLAACGRESTSYQRGYDDGVADVCNDIYRYSRDMFDKLRDKRIC